MNINDPGGNLTGADLPRPASALSSSAGPLRPRQRQDISRRCATEVVDARSSRSSDNGRVESSGRWSPLGAHGLGPPPPSVGEAIGGTSPCRSTMTPDRPHAGVEGAVCTIWGDHIGRLTAHLRLLTSCWAAADDLHCYLSRRRGGPEGLAPRQVGAGMGAIYDVLAQLRLPNIPPMLATPTDPNKRVPLEGVWRLQAAHQVKQIAAANEEIRALLGRSAAVVEATIERQRLGGCPARPDMLAAAGAIQRAIFACSQDGGWAPSFSRGAEASMRRPPARGRRQPYRRGRKVWP